MGQEHLETITLGAGCFWCVEAVYESIPGVESGVSGYSGGHIKNPGYREVCTGRTGHAEVVQVTFDNTKLSLAELLEVFFATHDPTTLNRQGADVGTQYRSAIYVHNDAQREVAEAAKLKAQADWNDPIVTEITAFETFYEAEDYHQALLRASQRSAVLSSCDCAQAQEVQVQILRQVRPALSGPSFFGLEALDFFVEHGDHLGACELRDLGVVARLVFEEPEHRLLLDFDGDMHTVGLVFQLTNVLAQLTNVANGVVCHFSREGFKLFHGFRRLGPTSSLA